MTEGWRTVSCGPWFRLVRGPAPARRKPAQSGGRGLRGRVRGLSSAAKVRFLEFLVRWLSSVDPRSLRFVVLTFAPVGYSEAWARARIKALKTWLTRHGYPAVWWLQEQRSGRLHVHLLLDAGDRSQRVVEYWLKSTAGTSRGAQYCQPVRSRYRAALYLVREAGHGYQDPKGTGRTWGRLGIDESSLPELVVRPATGDDLRRLSAAWAWIVFERGVTGLLLDRCLRYSPPCFWVVLLGVAQRAPPVRQDVDEWLWSFGQRYLWDTVQV